MKTALVLGLALGLGAASVATAFDQDVLSSKKANVTYGKMALKEIKSEKAPAIAREKAPENKATVAVTRGIGSGERDLGKADTSRQNSKVSLTTY